MKQFKLYPRSEMAKTIRRDRGDYENEKAGELLASKKYQARAMVKKGYSVALIAKLLKLSQNAVTRYLIEAQ